MPIRLYTASVLALAVSFQACGPATAARPDETLERLPIERLVFVPQGDGLVPTESVVLRWSNPVDLLVDRCEVTRGLWRELSGLPDGSELAAVMQRWDEVAAATDVWPATHVTLHEARLAARLRGMRLPTVEEWFYCAVGKTGGPWPWGTGRKRTSANTIDLRLSQPVAVGTFENGRTRSGLYDMLGNVWEWSEGDSFGHDIGVGDEPWILGGSWAWSTRPLIDQTPGTLLARQCDQEYWADDLGFRCVVDARTYLRRVFLSAEADREWSLPRYRGRMRALGRRWGPSAIGLLSELAREGPLALGWILEGARE